MVDMDRSTAEPYVLSAVELAERLFLDCSEHPESLACASFSESWNDAVGGLVDGIAELCEERLVAASERLTIQRVAYRAFRARFSELMRTAAPGGRS